MKRLLSAALFAAIASLGLSMAPASAQYLNGGHVQADHLCTSRVAAGFPTGCSSTLGDTQLAYETTSNTLTQVIAAPTSGSIRIPAGSVSLTAFMSATGGVAKIVQGTGSNCASNATTLFSVDVPATTVVNVPLPQIIAKATYAICLSFSAGTLTDAGLYGAYSVW